jgi:hypothetical protein
MYQSTEYTIWENMVSRCTNKNNPRYDRYGGRGIKVCDRWRAFENFLVDVGSRPSSEHTLDRYPDNDGHYEPGNVRWATRKQQQRNMSRNVFVELDGQHRTVSEWEELRGFRRGLISRRLKRGWPPRKAITTPTAKQNKHVVFMGQQTTIASLCAERGISRMMVHLRLKRGWTLENALTTPNKRPAIVDREAEEGAEVTLWPA